MVSQGSKTVSEAIVALFEKRQTFSAVEIHHQLQESYGVCSIRSVYKELNGLIEEGVLLRAKRRYMVSLTWVLTLIDRANRIYTNVTDNPLKEQILPSEGKKIRWVFRNLQQLDRLWLQVMFLLYDRSHTKIMWVWIPYFWFDLIHFHKDLEAQEAMRVAGNKMYMILGDRNYLSRLPEKYWSKKVYTWSYAESPFNHLTTKYFDVIDDYVVTIEIDEKTTSEMKKFFQSIKGSTDLKRIPEFTLITENVRASLMVEHNRAKAAKLKKVFKEFFGVVQ